MDHGFFTDNDNNKKVKWAKEKPIKTVAVIHKPNPEDNFATLKATKQ